MQKIEVKPLLRGAHGFLSLSSKCDVIEASVTSTMVLFAFMKDRNVFFPSQHMMLTLEEQEMNFKFSKNQKTFLITFKYKDLAENIKNLTANEISLPLSSNTAEAGLLKEQSGALRFVFGNEYVLGGVTISKEVLMTILTTKTAVTIPIIESELRMQINLLTDKFVIILHEEATHTDIEVAFSLKTARICLLIKLESIF